MDNYQTKPQNPKTFLKTITIIHAALTLGQILFVIAAFTIAKNTFLNTKPANDPFFYIVPLLALAGITAGSFLFQQQLKTLPDKNSLKEKMTGYQTAFITRCAFA
jgi:hypothetical protein